MKSFVCLSLFLLALSCGKAQTSKIAPLQNTTIPLSIQSDSFYLTADTSTTFPLRIHYTDDYSNLGCSFVDAFGGENILACSCSVEGCELQVTPTFGASSQLSYPIRIYEIVGSLSAVAVVAVNVPSAPPPPPPILGCTNPSAQNYESTAEVDDGTCIFASGA